MNQFCYLPWVGLDISPQGTFRPCCKYKESISDTLEGYLNSEELRTLRNDFKMGVQNPQCQRCWNDENAGLESKRQHEWKYTFNETDPGLDHIKILSFPFGNSCNLACRICDSFSSSTWIKEEEKLNQLGQLIEIYKHQRFYQNKQFVNQIKDISTHVVKLEFPGGEPFLAKTKEHLDFLGFLLTLDSSNISLHYITNATIFPKQEFWDIWKNFKNIDISLSIDSTEKQYEYQRWPACWKEVNSNIKKYQTMLGTSNNLQLSISHTISIFNVYYLPEFVIWCLKNKLPKPYLGLVSNPSRYDIRSLPSSVKEHISRKLSRYNFSNVVQYMNSEDLSVNFLECLDYIKLLDHQRNESFEGTFPEFYKLLEETKCQT